MLSAPPKIIDYQACACFPFERLSVQQLSGSTSYKGSDPQVLLPVHHQQHSGCGDISMSKVYASSYVSMRADYIPRLGKLI